MNFRTSSISRPRGSQRPSARSFPIHSSICFTRNGGETISPRVSVSRAGGRSWRFGSSFVFTGGERFDAAQAAHLARRIDAEGAEQGQVVDVDAELHFLVVLHHQLGGGRRLGLLFILSIEADRGVEDDVEVVAFVPDSLDLPA